MAVTYARDTRPASAYVSPAHAQSGVPTFRAGHEGPIPFSRSFARSNTKPQLKLGIKDALCGHQEAVPLLVACWWISAARVLESRRLRFGPTRSERP